MVEMLTGVIIIVTIGLLVLHQFRSSRVPPNAQLLFDILQEMGDEATFGHLNDDNKRTVKQGMKGV